MQLTQVHNIELEKDEKIIATTLSSLNELVILSDSGDVSRFNIDLQEQEHLFSVKSSIGYEDGGFDLNAPTSIYTLDSIVVVVNDFKRHGFVHYPEKYNRLHLWRKDYYADTSQFPIALFKNEHEVPHLIYTEDWNHLQIMNLDTRQILTAAKSLIEENAEERHLEFYKKHQESNKLPWPRRYDYFFGELRMSPNNSKFLSLGWAWGSCDAYNVYEVKNFIENNRIVDIPINGWEHSERAACWVDEKTIAIAYNPLEEGDDDATKNSSQEIHFYQILAGKSEIKNKIQVKDLNLVNSKFHFNKELNSILSISNDKGFAMIDLDGNVLFENRELDSITYSTDLNRLIQMNENSIQIYKMEI